jgi:hypothetical protein
MEHLSLCTGTIRGTWRAASFLGTFEIYVTVLGTKPQPMCLCECEALATLRHINLGSSFTDPKDTRGLSLGAVRNFFRRTGLS